MVHQGVGEENIIYYHNTGLFKVITIVMYLLTTSYLQNLLALISHCLMSRTLGHGGSRPI